MNTDLFVKHSIRTILTVFLCGLFLVGVMLACGSPPDEDRNKKDIGRFDNIQTIKYDGHEYLLYNTAVGSSITHKANCKYDN